MRKKSVFEISALAGFLTAVLIAVMTIVYPARARTIVYLSNADSREIYVLELFRDGDLETIAKIPVSGKVMPLAISPNRKVLYAGLRSEPYSVTSFLIDPASGKLSLLETAPLPDNMAYLSTDRTGRFLFGASFTGNVVSVNGIDAGGAISKKPLQIVPTGKNAHCILTDLSNKFLFVSNMGDDRLQQFLFDETSGRIAPNDPPSIETRKNAGPRHFVFHPDRRYVFAVNELDGTLDTFRLGASGKLSLVGSNSLMPAGSVENPSAADIHLTPDGKFLYATERATNTIAAFRVEAKTGKLTAVGNFPTETQPRGFNIDPTGKYLLCAGQKSNRLTVYRIDRRTGNLRPLKSLAVGLNPNWIEIIELAQ